jgi:hypothetical protein
VIPDVIEPIDAIRQGNVPLEKQPHDLCPPFAPREQDHRGRGTVIRCSYQATRKNDWTLWPVDPKWQTMMAQTPMMSALAGSIGWHHGIPAKRFTAPPDVRSRLNRGHCYQMLAPMRSGGEDRISGQMICVRMRRWRTQWGERAATRTPQICRQARKDGTIQGGLARRLGWQ